MKFILLIVMLTLPSLALAQEESDDVANEQTSITPGDGSIDPEKAKEIMEQLGKGQKMREDQTKFLNELDTEED